MISPCIVCVQYCSLHRGDIMMHVGEQGDKSLSISIENSDVLNIPRCTHDIPHMHHDISPMYSWYSSDVLMIFLRCTDDIPQCTDDIPLMYPPSPPPPPPDLLNISWCTPDIPLMYWTLPDVLMASPWRTEHTLYRVDMPQKSLQLDLHCPFPDTNCLLNSTNV